ncbi:unnamed protein product [Discosporangium mesarthrocarpum]
MAVAGSLTCPRQLATAAAEGQRGFVFSLLKERALHPSPMPLSPSATSPRTSTRVGERSVQLWAGKSLLGGGGQWAWEVDAAPAAPGRQGERGGGQGGCLMVGVTDHEDPVGGPLGRELADALLADSSTPEPGSIVMLPEGAGAHFPAAAPHKNVWALVVQRGWAGDDDDACRSTDGIQDCPGISMGRWRHRVMRGVMRRWLDAQSSLMAGPVAFMSPLQMGSWGQGGGG